MPNPMLLKVEAVLGSREQMAVDAGVSRYTVDKWFQWGGVVKLRHASRLARAYAEELGVPVSLEVVEGLQAPDDDESPRGPNGKGRGRRLNPVERRPARRTSRSNADDPSDTDRPDVVVALVGRGNAAPLTAAAA